MNEAASEALVGKLKIELRKEDIKLWKEPYTTTGGEATNQVKLLASQLSSKLHVPEDQALFGLNYLRTFALERQRQNSKFKLENIATIRLKFTPKSICCENFTSIEVKLEILGEDLINVIAGKLNIESSLIKLVYGGKIVDPKLPLKAQGVQHNKTLMCMFFSAESKQQTIQAEKEVNEVRKARRGAELLASSHSSTAQNYDAVITDQNGRAIDLPLDERASLMVALGLHEKGKAILKKKKYSYALLFLLEADTEFRQCRSEILNLVDNFAVLCLDISWCYLCMKNLDALPDVSDRLKTSEIFFNKSYGASLHRLLAIKGHSGHEIALFVRLYVLQGIVSYHEGNYTMARDLLTKAKSYAVTVRVDDEKIVEMINLGFTPTEARLALRICEGNVLAASRHAFQKREEKEKILKDEKEKSRKRKLARSLGSCANGLEINIDIFEKMVNEFGFDKALSAEALKQCNNSLDKAIQLVHENPGLLKPKAVEQAISDTAIRQVTEFGFDPVSAEAALIHFDGNQSKTIEYLLSHQGVVPVDWLQEVSSSSRPSSSSSSRSSLQSKADNEAMQKLAKVVNSDQDAYLDVNLDEESEYVSTYLAMISSVLD